MAVRIDASGDYLSRTTNLPTATTMTVYFRVYLVNDRNAAGALFIFYSGANYQAIYLAAADGTTIRVETNNGGTNGSSLSTGTWYDVCYVRDTANHYMYLDGVLNASRTDNNSLSPTTLWMGSDTVRWLDGRLSDIIIYSAAHTADQVARQYRRKVPVEWASINGWYPTFTGATERLKDYSGQGNDWTANGTLTDEDNRAVSWGAPSYLLPYVSGGTTYTTSLSGTVTPSGTLTKQPRKILAGGVTPSATLTKQANKIFSGGITPSGTLAAIKIALLSITGSLTPAGTLIKQANKLTSGGITPAATVVKLLSKGLAGSLTPSGTLTNVKVALLSLVGSLTPTGSLTKRGNKALSGALSLIVGTLTKQPAKSFAGSLTPSGTVARIKAALLSISGSIMPAGTLVKQPAKSLIGSLTPGGSLIKRVAKTFAGVITPAGVFSAVLNSFTALVVSLSTIFDNAYHQSTILDAVYYGSLMFDSVYYGSRIFDASHWASTIYDEPHWDSD